MTRMLLNSVSKILAHTVGSSLVAFINVRDIISDIVAWGVGFVTIIYICYQIKKLRKDLKKE